jgi:hypothetical protein
MQRLIQMREGGFNGIVDTGWVVDCQCLMLFKSSVGSRFGDTQVLLKLIAPRLISLVALGKDKHFFIGPMILLYKCVNYRFAL